MKPHHLLFTALLSVFASNGVSLAAPLAPETNDLPLTQRLPAVPQNLPKWMFNRNTNAIFPKRGPYNNDIFNIPTLARDMNAVAVGHALAYEALVTARANSLETQTFQEIDAVLSNPPKLMPDEKFISPTFGRKYGVLEQVFEWTHVLHAQTLDVLASTKLSPQQKDREIEALWKFYFDSVPYAITPLPMNMEWLDSQPYSKAFRTKYPKVNGLFWGYHWLQGSAYDLLWRQTKAQQNAGWNVIRARYHRIELSNTRRAFMPMFAEVSPKFAQRFPGIANAFDNLHMLHDLANDILASDELSQTQKEEQIRRAIWLVSAQAHANEKPGDFDAKNGAHDHRFMDGMPGMGVMNGGSTEVMWMPSQGWMEMATCHHCSMPLPKEDLAWKASEVSAEGWTMQVRCALCARDMSSETKGAAVLRLATEKPLQQVVIISDEEGRLTTDTPEVVFLEEIGNHARCNQWSQAFTSRAAFEAFVRENPKFKNAKPLTFAQWSERESAGTPDTYDKPKGPNEEHNGGEK